MYILIINRDFVSKNNVVMLIYIIDVVKLWWGCFAYADSQTKPKFTKTNK